MKYEFLRKIPLFMGLSEADLEHLCEMVTEVQLTAGEELFPEGSPGDRAYVIKSGQLEILKDSDGRRVLLAVRQAGEVIGEMSLLESAPRFATVRARKDSVLLEINHKDLDHLLNTSPSAAKAMLHTITARLRSSETVLRQSEKMAQLGTMTAGIAHELNNPAAAMGRGASQLQDWIGRLQQAHLRLSELHLADAQKQALLSLDQLAKERALQPLDLDPLGRSDRQEQLEAWLETHDIIDGWELAPILVDLGYQEEQLNQLAEAFQAMDLPTVVRWVEATYSIYSLLEEIVQGTAHMSEIVKALKAYVYLDQAPVQAVDVHEGLDNTLVMLRGKLKGGVTVRREYAPRLPRIMAYGSELNQVWTNIIDNAIDAMENQGELVLRTWQEDRWICVEIQDNGPGIPLEIQPRLFDPFFTTKPVGKGTGLGLNISYNIVKKHGGEIKVVSQPGWTCFTIRLPEDFEDAESEKPVSEISMPSDETLARILKDSRSIAVVGISDKPDVPAYTVPKYLQDAGYQIYPVNPRLQEILGAQAYPELLAIPDPVDVVLIFRRSEQVPAIVDQAIEIGAKVVWMQEGIINEPAAAVAQKAGLDTVMNTCMRVTHRRLGPHHRLGPHRRLGPH
jgi:signal transduction histidine kinase/predicted CoA-binding protein